MTYAHLKTLHILSVMLWMGTMLLLPVAVYQASRLRSGAREQKIARIRTVFLRVTTPAMIATWVLGITLLTWGGWMTTGWMKAKLLLVVALSGLHGWQSGRLRRLDQDTAYTPPLWTKSVMCAGAIVLVCVISLAVIKPF